MKIGFYENVEQIRKKLEMTKRELSEKAGIPYETLRSMYRRKNVPKPRTADKIAAALGVKKETLLAPVLVPFTPPDTDAEQNLFFKRTKAAMVSMKTYKPEFDPMIEIYASLLTQYEHCLDRFERGEARYTEVAANGGTKKTADVQIIESLRKDIATYSSLLYLNPRSAEKIMDKTQPTSKLGAALEVLNSG